MKQFSNNKSKPKTDAKRRYNSFEHRVVANLRDGKSDYIFDKEHLNKIKGILETEELIYVEAMDGTYFIRMATEKEKQKNYSTWMKFNKVKASEKTLHDYYMDRKVIWGK